MSDRLTEATFLREVANHQMTIQRDDGLYRNIRFKQPGTGNLYFDITTWPGYLCFSGDAGCFVFSRIDDMFEFFRRGDISGALTINPCYWSEKLQAVDRCSGVERYSEAKFREVIANILDECEASVELREAVEDEVLTYADDEHEGVRAAYNFKHGKFQFEDIWEYDFKEYTWRFLWCCYAVAWAVRQYDAREVAKVGEGVSRAC